MTITDPELLAIEARLSPPEWPIPKTMPTMYANPVSREETLRLVAEVRRLRAEMEGRG